MSFEGAPKIESTPAEPEKKKEQPAKRAEREALSPRELRERKAVELEELVAELDFQEGRLDFRAARKSLAQRLNSLDYANPTEVAEVLADNDYFPLIFSENDKFPGLDNTKIALEIIDQRHDPQIVVDELSKLRGADHDKIADHLIKIDPYWVINYFHKFNKISKKTIQEIMKFDEGLEAVGSNLSKFPELDSGLVAGELMDRGYAFVILNNWKNFPGVDKKKLAEKLLKQSPGELLENLEKFKFFKHEELVELLLAGHRGDLLAHFADKLKGVDHKELAFRIIETGDVHSVATYIGRFPKADRGEIAERIISTGKIDVLLQSPGSFSPKINQLLAEDLVKKGDLIRLAQYRNSLKGVDVTAIINAEVAKRRDDPKALAKLVATNLKAFDKLDYAMASLLMDHGYIDVMRDNLKRFQLSDKERLEIVAKQRDIPPDLLEALQGSEYGVRFLEGFHKFDTHYQTKVRKLSKLQSESIGEDGRVSRAKFQEALLSFGRNKTLLGQVEKAGVNVKEWLNFNEREIFQAGASKQDPIENAKIPMTRIARDMNHAAIKIRLVENDVSALVKTIKFPETPEEKQEREQQIGEARNQIEAIKARMADVPPERRAGMEKATVGLTGKLEQLGIPRERKSEDVLNGSLTNFRGAKKSLFERIKKFYRLKSGEPGAEQEKQAGVLRDEIFRSADQMKKRYEELSEIMKRINESSSQEVFNVKRLVGEEMEHLKQDVNHIKLAFAKAEQSRGSRFSIGVWDRSLKEDMFLGNYTDCCIRADSEYQGSNLPLSDYLADLGIQVVVVRDEVKNKPVYAAWCWLGKNNQGETAIVIDNIEGYPTYANRYRGIMRDKIFNFVENYGRAVGVNKVVLGRSNNDVNIGDLKDDAIEDSFGDLSAISYKKLGGQADRALNDSEDGVYYLEVIHDYGSAKLVAKLKSSAEKK
ncbi:MAG: hypothetical protein AAB389_04365 [Patescibacteria group bacterium]